MEMAMYVMFFFSKKNEGNQEDDVEPQIWH